MGKRYIAIEGNIGSGKTTLAQRFTESGKLPVLLEPHENNPFLAGMYRDFSRWAFSTQVGFLYLRSRAFTEFAAHNDLFVVDRSIFADIYVFARAIYERGGMSADEFNFYLKWADWFTKKEWGLPEVVVYLKCPTDVLLKRIKARGRGMESGIEPAYLDLLNRKHDEMIEQFKKDGIKVITIESDKVDYTLNADSIIARVISETRGKSERPRLIAVEGNIAAGKTTLTRALRLALGATCADEKWEENPFLAKMYEKPKRWALATQLSFLLSRAKTISEAIAKGRTVICDRTPLSERFAFAEVLRDTGDLSPEEFRLYCDYYEQIVPRYWKPFDLVIYVRSDVETLMKRIESRGRPMEQKITRQYMTRLNQKFESLFRDNRAKLTCPVITVESDEIDFHDLTAVQQLVDSVPQLATA